MPLTAFTGLPQDSPFCALVEIDEIEPVSMDEIPARKICKYHEMDEALEKMHGKCSTPASKKSKASFISHNRMVGVRPVEF